MFLIFQWIPWLVGVKNSQCFYKVAKQFYIPMGALLDDQLTFNGRHSIFYLSHHSQLLVTYIKADFETSTVRL